jgi:hypothetical protein
VYALINDRAIPVESLRSLVAGPGGRVLIAGAASSDEDRRQVQNALSALKKKDVVSFNVVTSDWRAMTGMAKITDVLVSSKSKTVLHFFIAMKMTKDSRPSKKK